MSNRILDISDQAVYLSVRGEILVLSAGQDELDAIPVADLAAVITSHPQVRFSQAVLARLANAGVAFISCDEKRMPVSMLLPIRGHWSQTERFARQATFSMPKRKRLWQKVVRAKIQSQGSALRHFYGLDYGLGPMVRRVGSGDPANVEAQASRRYWLVVFDDPDFRRSADDDVRNSLLNYGYAVLRGATARALTGAGLHPSVGLHHKNKLNAYPLADDMMEPFRPCVDRAVVTLWREFGNKAVLDAQAKRRLLDAVTRRYVADGEQRTLFDILARTAQSLAGIVMGEEREIYLPELEPAE